MGKVYIDKAAAQHAVLHNEGQAAVAAIEAIQPEDVAPVIRCVKCKWYLREYPNGLGFCDRDGYTHSDDWFCADGKRKDDAE